MTTRVIHFGTGYSGTHALRGIIDHPDLELAALVVHGEDKVGRDAGELAGVTPVGVTATQDVEEALATDADAFCYMATTHGRFKAAIADVCSILESGTNVVTTSFGLLIHPGSARPDVRERLDHAARGGGVSFLSTGIEPGFFSDYLPVVLSGCAHRIDSLRVYELAVYESGHQSDEVAFDVCGFGQPVDSEPPIVNPSGMLQWAGVVRSMAEQLDVELDDIATSHELLPAPEAFEYQGRRIEAGTIAGFRFEIAGVSGGRKRIAIEHITRTRADQAPDWPSSSRGDVYRVELDGSPRLECEFAFREGDDHLAGGFNITAMRAVNAIPALCAAPPGVLSTFDLAPVTGRGRFT
jgi:4-hydroxy-tetrahydrodipicolinate reductase